MTFQIHYRLLIFEKSFMIFFDKIIFIFKLKITQGNYCIYLCFFILSCIFVIIYLNS